MTKFIRSIAVLIFSTSLLGACDASIIDPSAPTNVGNNYPSPNAPVLSKKPGYVTGQVVNSAGQPFTVANSLAHVTIRGTSTFGERQVLNPPVAPNGKFELQVPDGTYSVEGRVEVMYEGKKYSIPLESSVAQAQSTANGISANLVVKIAGPKPGELNKFYGGDVSFSYRGGNDSATFPYPDDTKMKFTLTSQSLIDGSTGKVLTLQRTVGELKSNSILNDVPIGKYAVTGQATLADGIEKTLVFYDATAKQYLPNYQFIFQPSLISLDTVEKEVVPTYHPVN